MLRESTKSVIGDHLAARLLPVLMHRMNNATQLLSNLHAIGQVSAERDWIRERADDLAHSSTDIEQLGFLLAVLASASGTDLLLERREARGVQYMIDAVTDAIRRDGVEVREGLREFPAQSPAVHHGWELAWAVGALLQQSGTAEVKDGPFEWQLLEEDEAWVLVSSWIPADHFEALLPLLTQRLPETQLDICREGWSWRFPRPWLAERT